MSVILLPGWLEQGAQRIKYLNLPPCCIIKTIQTEFHWNTSCSTYLGCSSAANGKISKHGTIQGMQNLQS